MLDTQNHLPVVWPANQSPILCIVVDTEEEFDWSAPFSRNAVETNSILAQPQAHERVFDNFGITPTYVVDWPVANSPTAVAVLRGLMEEGRCEIGAHLHPWVSPPHLEEVNNFNSFAGNLPASLEFEKLKLLTQAITDNFGRKPTVFKAGRYGLGKSTSLALQRLGYQIDASVVPHTSFSSDGGPNFYGFDNQTYWFGSTDSPLLEVPVTTGYCGFLHQSGQQLYPKLAHPLAKTLHLGGIAARSGALERIRLTPEGVDISANKRLMRTLVQDGVRVLTLTYHSPSLEPGHTPYVRTTDDLSKFLKCLSECFSYFQSDLGGVFMTLRQLREHLLTPLEAVPQSS